jgi:hypothetical protein
LGAPLACPDWRAGLPGRVGHPGEGQKNSIAENIAGNKHGGWSG